MRPRPPRRSLSVGFCEFLESGLWRAEFFARSLDMLAEPGYRARV